MERELPKIPDSIPILVLANHRDMGHHRTITDDQVRTHIEHLDRSVVPSTGCSYSHLCSYYLRLEFC